MKTSELGVREITQDKVGTQHVQGPELDPQTDRPSEPW